LAVAFELGISQVFRCNGPAGIAALALGTDTIPSVRKIVGPGSPPVTAAQILAQRYGVTTNMLCGPSECVVLADDTADPWLLAADLMNEAEHGSDSQVILITTSRELAIAVDEAATRQIASLPDKQANTIRASLETWGGALLVSTLEEGADLANEFASEHLLVAVSEPDVLARLRYAGQILIGQSTPVSAANITIGSPASLPTGGFAQVNGGITARTFMTAAATSELRGEALGALASATLTILRYEGFPAHANAIEVRDLEV
jgi:histidinol dehydrogenase